MADVTDRRRLRLGWSRRALLFGTTALAVSLAGSSGGGLAASATPPPVAFELTAVDDRAVELRDTVVGSQEPAKFRVVLEGAGEADGTYGVDDVTGDSAWSAEDRYGLNQSTLGLSAPLGVGDLTVTLQYDDDGDRRTLVRKKPTD